MKDEHLAETFRPIDKIDAITTERGINYGHPIKHFYCTNRMYETWQDARNKSALMLDEPHEAAIRHGVYMILDKLARLSENPQHRDNLDDIQGYAKCIGMVLDWNEE